MSILDRVTKAVGDVVDRGKKEVDQFVRIQKINSQIGDLEKKTSAAKGQIQLAKVQIGDLAIEMLRAGTLASPEMTALLDQITGIEQQIGSLEAEIASVRAEGAAVKVGEPVKAGEPAMDVPPPSRFCPQCGVPAATGAFCPQCGTKLA
jgi:chromosome segregation ATPase